MLIKGVPEIEVVGNPGIYTMAIESGTGKTYLARCLHDHWLDGDEVFSYTCEDYFKGDKPWDLIKGRHPKLIMMDRADHYCEDKQLVQYLLSLCEEVIVLVDIKCLWRFPLNCRFANVVLRPSKLEVLCD